MYTSRGMSWAGLVLLTLLVAGCATAPTRLESAYGISYEVTRVLQILQPDAATPVAPVEELDGKAAHNLLERYRATFEKPPPPPSFAISVGSIQ